MEEIKGLCLDLLGIAPPWPRQALCKIWWSLESIWSRFGFVLEDLRAVFFPRLPCSIPPDRPVRGACAQVKSSRLGLTQGFCKHQTIRWWCTGPSGGCKWGRRTPRPRKSGACTGPSSRSAPDRPVPLCPVWFASFCVVFSRRLSECCVVLPRSFPRCVLGLVPSFCYATLHVREERVFRVVGFWCRPIHPPRSLLLVLIRRSRGRAAAVSDVSQGLVLLSIQYLIVSWSRINQNQDFQN